MRSRVRIVVGCVLLCAVSVGGAYASGYAIYEHGAEAMANAGAFTARADNPSALFFNPAGIMQLEGIQFDFGTTAIFLTGSEFTDAMSGLSFAQEDNVVFPPNFYYTQKISQKLAWGFAITSPFGLKTEWDASFSGRFISRESHLVVVNFNPNLAFSLGRKWTAAVGVNYAFTDIKALSRNIDLSALGPFGEGFTEMQGDGDDFGWNVAAQWVGETGWRWGLSYRSEMEPVVEGEVRYTDIPAPLAALFPDGPASADLPLPATVATGVSYSPNDKWEAEFDIVWTDWSVFDVLLIEIQNTTSIPNPSPPPATLPVVEDIRQFENWEDTFSFRAGFSYHVTPRHEWRTGAYYDQNPIDADRLRPRLPDADRTSVQLGYGYTGPGKFRFDIAYQALFFDDRTAVGDPASGIPGATPGTGPNPVQPGDYENFTSLLGVSFRWVLGQP